jgi:hypothetical protein
MKTSSESGMRKSITAEMRAQGMFAMAVDNESCYPGTPDVYYCGHVETQPTPMMERAGFVPTFRHAQGWMELKIVKSAPAREATLVKVRAYTEQQRICHRAIAKAGGKIHMLVVVGLQWILLDGEWAADHLGKVPLLGLQSNARTVWTGGFRFAEIKRWL